METDTRWLSAEEAARYLGMGKTALYERARAGRIPANKVGEKWMFNRAILDSWMHSQRPMSSFFLDLDFNIENNDKLRRPQRDAYLSVCNFFRSGKNRAIIQMPVGCGKTGLAALLPFGLAEGRVIIIAPNLTIKDSLYDAMDISNRQGCFWHKMGVLNRHQAVSGPFTSKLDTGNVSVANKSHIIITNIQQLATNTDKWLNKFSDNFFDMIIVDEAHHSAAESWQKVIDRFPAAKVILMTATPFRSDRQEIQGELAFRYSFRSATINGFIKTLKAHYVTPSQVELVFRDKQKQTYSLEQVLKLKEEKWFSLGIALSRPCNKHIVETSLEKLEELRQSGTKHQLIAVACSIDHAREVRSLYKERGYNADVIHSKQPKHDQEAVINALRNGTLDCIVQVYKLGEGFDHPKLSVAAIFRPYRTLAPYIQFVGRIMRVIEQDKSGHPDNVGHIVTHLGMNLDELLIRFNQFENDDLAFWDDVIGGDKADGSKSSKSEKTSTAHNEAVVVTDETVDSTLEEDFLTDDDQYLVDDIREQLDLLGFDPTHAEEFVKKARFASMRKLPATEPFVVQPQREWEEARVRLNEKAKQAAKQLLDKTNLSRGGTELAYKYRVASAMKKNNYASAVTMVNQEIRNVLGKERKDASAEEFKQMSAGLDAIIATLVDQIANAKLEYEQAQT